MISRSLLVALPLFVVAACSDGSGPDSDRTAILTARANGHTVTRQEFPGYPFAYYDTTYGFVAITGDTDPNAGPFEHIGLFLWQFSGRGTYPLHVNQGSGGSAYYGVTTPTAVIYQAEGGKFDYALVTEYDPLSGRIAGTFTFTGVDYLTGDSVRVTEGRFAGRVVRH